MTPQDDFPSKLSKKKEEFQHRMSELGKQIAHGVWKAEFAKKSDDGTYDALRYTIPPPSSLVGIPVVIVPNLDSEDDEVASIVKDSHMIFEDEDDKLPEFMESEWIQVIDKGSSITGTVTETGEIQEEEILFEAKCLRLNEAEAQYLLETRGLEIEEELKEKCTNLWIVRISENDSDQQIISRKDLEKNFSIKTVNGNKVMVEGSIDHNNKAFWATAIGFCSNDVDLKQDGQDRLFFS